MICPFCLHKKSSVFNSRSTNGGLTTWRRRRCDACSEAYTTQESFDPSGIWRVTKNQKTVPYSRPKLALSLLRACDHRSNQDSAAWYLFGAVEQRLFSIVAQNNGTMSADAITEAAARVLKNYDAAAYIKYLSYHQQALDAATLRKQLRKN